MKNISKILSLEFDEYNNLFTIQFSTTSDGEEFCRFQEMEINIFEYYYPDVFDINNWKDELEDERIIYMLEKYYEEDNEFPPHELL